MLRADRARGEAGSAVVESVFGILFLMLLVMGAIQVTFALYGRNVLLAAAHDGARAAIELGRDPASADALATDTITSSAGGMVRDLDVHTSFRRVGDQVIVRVSVRSSLEPMGPVPILIPVTATSTVSRRALTSR